MAVLTIPTSTTLPLYRQAVTLEDERFIMDLRYNTRMGAWFLSLFDSEGNALAEGRRLTIDSRLIGQHKYRDGMPPGELMAFDTTGRKAPATFDELGDRVLLLYVEIAELTG